jgi:hypothetical protein
MCNYLGAGTGYLGREHLARLATPLLFLLQCCIFVFSGQGLLCNQALHCVCASPVSNCAL